MITSDGWLDWAERMPVQDFSKKTWDGTNTRLGYIPHSAVGSLQGVIDVVFDPNSGRSVHGAIGYNGRTIQFYPFTACCWASGERVPNSRFIAFENEGGRNIPSQVNEVLTEEQIQANVRIIKDLSANRWTPRRPVNPSDKTATLYEHREMIRWGADATACPSGRIPWDEILRRLAAPDVDQQLKVELDERRNRLLLEHVMLNHYTLGRSDDDQFLSINDGNVVVATIKVPSKPSWWGNLPPIK